MLFVLSVAMCSSLDVQGNTVTRLSLPQILFCFQDSAEAELIKRKLEKAQLSWAPAENVFLNVQ